LIFEGLALKEEGKKEGFIMASPKATANMARAASALRENLLRRKLQQQQQRARQKEDQEERNNPSCP